MKGIMPCIFTLDFGNRQLSMFLCDSELVNSKIDLINFEFIWEQFHSNLKHPNPKIAIDMNLTLLNSLNTTVLLFFPRPSDFQKSPDAKKSRMLQKVDFDHIERINISFNDNGFKAKPYS